MLQILKMLRLHDITVILFISLAIGNKIVWCLRDVELVAPSAVRAGSWLSLECIYDLESAPLYSIKFYLGDQEFYRYVPKESPPTRVFPLPGITVDDEEVFRSNSTVVRLDKVEKELSGIYKCEVSADAPLFHTLIKTAHVYITEEPAAVPDLSLEKSKYTLGERIRANCTSNGAFPAANLTFFINSVQVESSERTRLWYSVEKDGEGLESSRLELEATAAASMFREGRLKVGCVASQFDLYARSTSVYVHEDTPQLAHVLGPASPPDHLDSNQGRNREPAIFLTTLITLSAILLRKLNR